MSTSLVPRSVEEVTPEWFTGVLLEAGVLGPGDSVTALQHKRIGNGLVGESIRFDLTYDSSDPNAAAPASVVCKFPSSDPTFRAAATGEHIYVRENAFYRDLASSLGIRSPKCLHLAEHDSTDDFVLVLEDLGPAEAGDQVIGCNLAQAEAAMDAAAGLHAPMWGNADLESATWNVRSAWVPRIARTYAELFSQYAHAFSSRVSDDDLAIGRAFAPVIERWFTNQPGPWTVTHGDFRLDNMLFEIRNGAEPIGVVDWQTILVGPGTVDVSYFIGASLPTEVRRASENDLVRRYHNGLLERGVPDYSFEQCWNNYRYSAFHGYFMATYAPLLVQRTERGDAMFALWVERVAAQLRDLDSLSVLAQI